MGKISFVFSGQGDQYPGFGKPMYDGYEAARRTYALCDAVRPGTAEMCLNGTDEELKETKNTQPCLFTMELAAFNVLTEKGIRPDCVAGFSLGEVVAATAAGIFDEKTGFELVCRRGELMQQCSEKFDTAMAAVVKLSDEKVEEIAAKYDGVYPVNYNCPGQVTVSGLKSAMPEFNTEVKAAGGRAIPLKVSGAFHSPFMAEAASEFGKCLAVAQAHEAKLPIYSDMTAEIYSGSVEELLSKQICSPVRWEKIIRNMLESGVDTFVEVGPGRTLTNMIKKIAPEAKTYCVAELDTLLEEVAGC